MVTSLDEINAVGHRIVHGGEKFAGSVLIDDEVLKAIEACNEAIRLDNSNKRAWYNRGSAYRGLGASNPNALEQAWIDFNYAYQIDPAYSAALEARDQLDEYMRSIGYQPSDDGGFQGGKGN